MSTKDGIIKMWNYSISRGTIINYARNRLNIPDTCKTEYQKIRYVVKYIDHVINNYIKERRECL